MWDDVNQIEGFWWKLRVDVLWVSVQVEGLIKWVRGGKVMKTASWSRPCRLLDVGGG